MQNQTPHSIFNFGENWLSFSIKVLTENNLEDAMISLKKLLEINTMENKTFLDIGCGSGLFSIVGVKLGAAKVVGIDISKESIEASTINAGKFLNASERNKINFINADFLTDPIRNKFDIVYAWGSLHHTGNMWKAIDIASQRVNTNGIFAIAIYNKHWTSPVWKIIKKKYNNGSVFTKRILILFCKPLIFAAKVFLSGELTLKMNRGMDFQHDVIDWVGGYPYEYASIEELTEFIQQKGFSLIKSIPTKYGAGNNELVFKKI